MPINFFSFPSEIRNKIYEEALVLSEPIVLVVTEPNGTLKGLSLPRNSSLCGPLRLCLAILFANNRAHREASPLLYSRNRFRLQNPTLFLDDIGPQNASFLRHICIAFPAIYDYHHLESVTLKEDSIRTLERIRDNCTNLATLETSLRFRTIIAMESAIDIDSPRPLALVDARFKAISSLKEIIVNVYDEPISCDLREEMRGCGWTIEGTWEESESVGSYG